MNILRKPFHIKEFLLRVHNVLKRVYKDDPSFIHIDGYDIDEEKELFY